MKPERPSRRIGLARALSKAGHWSRSQAAHLIRAGHVKLNGHVRRDPETPVGEASDLIEVDGVPLAPARKLYLMLNKPRGLVTTTSDEKGRDTVYCCLPRDLPWVAPVGRLDKASEGLLLLTNDSEWAARVLDPESHLPKTYHVQVAAIADDGLVQSLIAGTRAMDGELLRAREARILRRGQRNSWLEVVLDEGKNRHIRRMMDELHIEVLRLLRVAIGPLQLGVLAKGCFRELTPGEKAALDAALGAAA